MLVQCHARTNRCLFKGLESLNWMIDGNEWEPCAISNVKAIARSQNKGTYQEACKNKNSSSKVPTKAM